MALDSRELRLQGIAPAPVIHYRITANNRMTIDRLIFHTNGVNEIAINQSRLFLRTLIEKGSITLDGDRVIPLKHIRIGNPTVESLAKKYSSLVNRNSNPEQYLASPLAEAILERTHLWTKATTAGI